MVAKSFHVVYGALIDRNELIKYMISEDLLPDDFIPEEYEISKKDLREFITLVDKKDKLSEIINYISDNVLGCCSSSCSKYVFIGYQLDHIYRKRHDPKCETCGIGALNDECFNQTVQGSYPLCDMFETPFKIEEKSICKYCETYMANQREDNKCPHCNNDNTKGTLMTYERKSFNKVFNDEPELYGLINVGYYAFLDDCPSCS